MGTANPAHTADETGAGLHITCHPGAQPDGPPAYRPGGACGRRPWLAFVAAAPLFKVVGLCPATRKLFGKSLTKNFRFSLPSANHLDFSLAVWYNKGTHHRAGPGSL